MVRSLAVLPALAFGILLIDFFPSASSVLCAQSEEQSTEQPQSVDPDKHQDPETRKTTSLKSPRQTLRTYLWAMERKDYGTAITALDFSKVDPTPDSFSQVKYASQLNACLQQLPLVEDSQVSNSEEGPPVPFPPQQADSLIVIVRGEDGLWRFAPDTVAGVESIFKILVESASTNDPPVAKPTDADTNTANPQDPDDTTENVELPVQATPVPQQLESARRVMHLLFDSFENKDYASAVAAIDFSEMEKVNPDLSPYKKLSFARRLKETIERLAFIDYSRISDDPMGPTFRFPPDHASQPVIVTRLENGTWKFSAETVGRIDALHEVFKDKPVLNLSEEELPWYMRELVLGNETWRIISLFGALFVSLFIGQVLRSLLHWRANVLERRGHLARSTVHRTLAKAAVGLLFLVGLRAGISALVLDHDMERLVMTVLHVIFAVVGGYICFRFVDVVAELLHKLTKRSGSSLNQMIVPIVTTSMRLTVVILVGLEIATAISDQPPSAMLAGLGAGGLAIGLAAQETIKNLFGSVMIFADRPFELGERIVVDGHDGPVETVGFRSTRIRTLQGHLVTVPNGEIANKTIQNIGKRQYIRRTMNMRIASDTPPERIRNALEILRELLADHEGINEELPPRVFLEDFLESAINLRAIYWYHPPNYWDYCDFGERINLQIIEQFRAAGVRFAVPSHQIVLTDNQDSLANSENS